jgi:hypothetical protein
MVVVDWTRAYAERGHDETIQRIMRRLGSHRAGGGGGGMRAEQRAAVDDLVARLTASRHDAEGSKARSRASTSQTPDSLLVARVGEASTDRVQREQQINEMLGTQPRSARTTMLSR